MAADFWAGYLSGAIGIIIGNPLDVIKVRLQAGDSHADASSNLSRFERASSLVRGPSTSIFLYQINPLIIIKRRCCPDLRLWSSQRYLIRGLQPIIESLGRVCNRSH
jgi:hypothetical protein